MFQHSIDMRPTYTHEAISKLVNDGQAQFVISQNCDGLHLLSGVPMHAIAELHGVLSRQIVLGGECAPPFKRFL